MKEQALRVVFEPEVESYDPNLYECKIVNCGITGFEAVDEQQIATYHENGFLLVKEAFSSIQVESAKKELHDLTTSNQPSCESIYYEGKIRNLISGIKQNNSGSTTSYKLENLALGHTENRLPLIENSVRAKFVRKVMGFTRVENPALKHLADCKDMLKVVGNLIRGNPKLYQDMALIKPPGGREKPWHQDRAYFNLTEKSKIVGVWIALDNARVENGCMQVIEHGHKKGPKLHFMRRDWQICDKEILEFRRLGIPMSPGDCLFFDALLPHGTPANQTDSQRWAVQFHYVSQDSQDTNDEYRLEVFGSEGKDVSC